MKQSVDDNFEFDVNSSKFSELVENTMSEGEIALYEQFLLYPQCFQKVCFPGASKGVIVWEWVKPIKKHPLTIDGNFTVHVFKFLMLSDWYHAKCPS